MSESSIGRIRNDGGWDRRYKAPPALREDVPNFGLQAAYRGQLDKTAPVREDPALRVVIFLSALAGILLTTVVALLIVALT